MPLVRPNFPGSPRRASFTLVELIVAIAISTVLLVVLATLSGAALQIWQQETAYAERRDAAMTAFGQIRRDLRYAALPSDEPGGQFEMILTNQWGSGSANTNGFGAFWQAPSATVTTSGENAVVGYFVQWTTNVDNEVTTPKLCRVLINPNDSKYYIGSNGAPAWISSDLITYAAPAVAPTYQGLLCRNVLGLWMAPYDQTGTNLITTTATNGTFPTNCFDSRLGYVSANGRTYPNALPASMKVSVLVVDSHTALQLTPADAPPTTSTDPNAFLTNLPANIQKGAQLYSTVVQLVNAPQ